MKTKTSVIFIILILVNGAFAATGNPDILCTTIVDDLEGGCLNGEKTDEVFFSSVSLIIFQAAQFMLKLINLFDYSLFE